MEKIKHISEKKLSELLQSLNVPDHAINKLLDTLDDCYCDEGWKCVGVRSLHFPKNKEKK